MILKKSGLTKAIFLVAGIFFVTGAAYMSSGFKDRELVKSEGTGNLIWLHKGKVALGILTGAGGRIVYLKKDGSNNLLKSDEKLWGMKYTKPVYQLIDGRIIPFQGHIVWLGPQSLWWQQQDLNTFLKEKKAEWPPDPFLIYGLCNVLEKDSDRVMLQNPASPYSGVKLDKTIFLDEHGRVHFQVEASNVRDDSVSWDLWLNTRVDGWSRVYVPVGSKKNFRVQNYPERHTDPMNFQIIGQYFTFDPSAPDDGIKSRESKAFLYPASDRMFCFTGKQMLVIHFTHYEKKLVHPEQAVVEIYNRVRANGDALLELEYHSPFLTLEPGQKMSANEVWEIIDYPGENNHESHIKFIGEYQKKIITTGQRW